jgi:putative transposase
MPRTARAVIPGYCYHLLNRANKRAQVFHSDEDYSQFLALLSRAQDRLELPILALCLMPNHVHMVVQPRAESDLARWTHWVFTTHARWYHAKHSSTGRIWKGRYKAFPSQDDHHLTTVMRYVERNALRANLVERAEDWRWGSLRWRSAPMPPLKISSPPVSLPSYWRHLVNEPQTDAELAAIRTSVNRQRPFGSEEWVRKQAKDLELEASLAPIGRPRKYQSRRVPVS